jgi:hypothetical protein
MYQFVLMCPNKICKLRHLGEKKEHYSVPFEFKKLVLFFYTNIESMLLRIDDWYQDQSKQTVPCSEMYRKF